MSRINPEVIDLHACLSHRDSTSRISKSPLGTVTDFKKVDAKLNSSRRNKQNDLGPMNYPSCTTFYGTIETDPYKETQKTALSAWDQKKETVDTTFDIIVKRYNATCIIEQEKWGNQLNPSCYIEDFKRLRYVRLEALDGNLIEACLFHLDPSIARHFSNTWAFLLFDMWSHYKIIPCRPMAT